MTSKKISKYKYSHRDTFYGLLFVLPAFLFFVIFSIFPIFRAAYLSFTRYDLLTPAQFIGLKNYESIIKDPQFIQSFMATLYYTVVSTIFILPLSLGLALLLNKKFRLRDFYRAIYFSPIVMSLFALAVIWKLLYHPYGLINSVLRFFTDEPIFWLTSIKYAMPAIIIMRIWRGTGYYIVLFLAGLQSIPSEYYEAARIDGANRWNCFWYITWPLLKPTTLFVVVISVINALKSLDVFLIMTKGGPAGVTRVLALFIYQTGLVFFKMSIACTMSMVMFIFILLFTLIQLRVFRKEIEY